MQLPILLSSLNSLYWTDIRHFLYYFIFIKKDSKFFIFELLLRTNEEEEADKETRAIQHFHQLLLRCLQKLL